MKHLAKFLALMLGLAALPAFAAAPPYVQNNSIATTLNSNNGYPGSGSVDALGRQFTNYAPTALISRGCSSTATGTADTQILANPGAGIRYYITAISCANTSAVASEIVIKEGSTAIWRGGIGTQAATGGGYQANFDLAPLRMGANTVLNFAMTTTATSTTCCANGYQITD